jgi:ribonuclease HII
MVRRTLPADLFDWTGEPPLERRLIESGVTRLCGTDEAGRGPLAGPVVAAAVVFRDCEALWIARDSKVLSPRRREELFAAIASGLEWAVGLCSAKEIDDWNILRASLKAMERAVSALSVQPAFVLVDGPYVPALAMPSRAIKRGDARVAVISAASIVAKVTRDRIMRELDHQYPAYGFARHFGYPTPEHRAALRQHGPCPIHRRTFCGVRELLQTTE